MRKFFASVPFFLFVLLSVPLVFLFTFSRTYFSADFYRGPFLDRVYDQVISLTSDEIVHQVSLSGVSLDSEKVRQLAFQNFPKDSLRTIIDQVIVQFSSLNLQHSDLRLDFSSLEKPFRLFVFDVAHMFLAQQRICGASEVPAADVQNHLPSCIPPQWKNQDLDQYFAMKSQEFFPQSFSVSFRNNIQQIEFFRKVRSGISFLTIALLFILAILTFSMYPGSQRVRFSFLGKMFGISGLLIVAFAGILLSLQYFLDYQGFSQGFDPVTFTHFKAFASALISLFALPFLFYGLGFLFFGVLVYFYSRKVLQDI